MMLYWTGSIVSAVVGSSIVKFVRCHSWFIHCLVKRKLHFCLARNKDFKFTLCVGGSYLLFKLGDFSSLFEKTNDLPSPGLYTLLHVDLHV